MEIGFLCGEVYSVLNNLYRYTLHTHRTGLRGRTLPQITSAIEAVWTGRSTTNIVASWRRFFFIPGKSLARWFVS